MSGERSNKGVERRMNEKDATGESFMFKEDAKDTDDASQSSM